MASTPSVLWRHPDPRATPMFRFLAAVNAKHGLALSDYAGLHRWSVDHLSAFWEQVWDFVGVRASVRYNTILPTTAMFPRPDFFQGARLNFAENLLYPAGVEVDPAATALFTVGEDWNTRGWTTLSWDELREAVRRCANGLRRSAPELRPGDIVAGYVGNHAEALVAMLAAASMGAVWTSISPDTGVSAVLDRLAPVRPKVLFADHVSAYNGKVFPGADKTTQIVTALRKTGLTTLIVIYPADDGADKDANSSSSNNGINNEDADAYQNAATAAGAGDMDMTVLSYRRLLASADSDTPLHFEQLPPSHPLYILYSSGTTGLPKAIVHTALGTLIQHKKEHALHCSLGPASRMLYFTTTSWMMWHWSVSALAVGTSLVLYSGSPFYPYGPLSLPRLLATLKVTHFGTSAAYLIALETRGITLSTAAEDTAVAGAADGETIDLSALQAIYSTASPLPPSTFSYVYTVFPPHVHLASITGGTDIISLFGAPCPLLPVVAGRVQCIGLGMAVAAADSASPTDRPRLLPAGEEGDLVCTAPFPCEPLTFYSNDGSGDDKYRAAYFERFAGWWHHGDFVRVEVDDRDGGGSPQSLVMLGRSDGVLKPSGVRFGSAEIYNVLTRFFAGEIEDALCVGRRRPQDTDETVCLFVVMAAGADGRPVVVDDAVRARIKAVIRRELSPRHVPGIIEACGGGIPKTSNGKKIEVAVKKILSGMDVQANASVANPEALDWFRSWASKHG